MDTVTENSIQQSITASVDANGKRKSISFVDKKLISQALNSTSAPSEDKPNGKSNEQKQRNGQQHSEKKDNSHHGVRNAHTKNSGHQQGWNKRELSHTVQHRAKTKGSKNQASPVIIYYNDPEVEIDVKQLLTKCQLAGNADHAKSAHESSKRHNGHNKPQTNGITNGNRHNSKSFSSFNNNSEINGNWREKANSPLKVPQVTNRHKSEAITIYYGCNNMDVKESPKSLKQPVELPNSNDNSTLESKSSLSSSVIESSEITTNSPEENVAETKTMSDSNGTAFGDEYDVINGGDLIEDPVLPTEGSKHAVSCTMVSHPGHFYVKFIDERHNQQLAQMSGFYNNDEPIELSVDVLKPGQYFAAKATSKEPGQEWIRVQLLHLESTDLINCLLVDEGCFGMFKLSQLQPLYNQFRTVPKQAIRASLAGVKSAEIDWLPNQTLEFKSLVENRRLHTGEQQFQKWNEKDPIEIELYFDEDEEELKNKSVAQVLVEKGIAVQK